MTSPFNTSVHIIIFLKNVYRKHVSSLVNFIIYKMEIYRDDLDVSERIQFIVVSASTSACMAYHQK